MSILYSATEPVAIKHVGESWRQDNRSLYAWDKLPMVDCLDKRVGRTNKTSYKMAALGSAMLQAGLIDIEVGDKVPTSKKLEEVDVEFTVRGRGPSHTFEASLRRPVAHRLADVESNFTPHLLGAMFGGIESDLAAFVTNGSNFGSKTFSGTGALDAYASDQKPDVDIQNNLRALRKFQAIPGMGLTCILDFRVIDVLARHPNYVGAGDGSNSARILPKDIFLQRFKALHRLDEIIEMSATYNSARYGASESLAGIGEGLLWFGVVDKRKKKFDLKSDASTDAPDGALQLAMSREPELMSGVDTLAETETFYGKCSYEFFSPRGSTFGQFYPSSEIFT